MKHYFKSAIVLTLALAATVVFAACGKKKAPAPVVVPGPVAPAMICPNCTAASSLVASGLGAEIMNGQVTLELGLEFYSDGLQSSVPSNPNMRFTGNAFTYGNLRIQQNTASAYCNIPVGDYAIRPYQGTTPTYIAYGTAHNVALEASGPVQLLIKFPTAAINSALPAQNSSFGKSYPFRLVGWMYIYPQGTPCMSGVVQYFIQ